MKDSPTKIALFFPWIKSRGGAERIVLNLLKNSLYDIDVYTWVYEPAKTFGECSNFKIKVIAPKLARKISNLYLFRGLFSLISLFSKIPLENYDYFLVYTSGVSELITLKNYKKGKTFAYVNTPLRAACPEIVKWNLKNRYKNPFSKFVYKTAVGIYRFFEKLAWRRIDRAFFISKESMNRARGKNLLKNKNAEVLYVQLNLEDFKNKKTKDGNYFLYVSRFNLPKRQDLLIKAWKKFVEKCPKYKLILAGHVENKKYFQKVLNLANKTKNVEIKTEISDEKLLDLYAECRAVIFVAFKEDLGIVPFEALAMGKSVIGSENGGYVELIKDSPQFFKIREFDSEKEMISEINKVLEGCISKNVQCKRVFFKELGEDFFMKNFATIFKNN